MPKIVDNYVLERKIGSGQFGEVFKGYNKVTNVDIAVKCVKRQLIKQLHLSFLIRDLLKGKYMELLENEIKVLRTCDNENIIKLYDIKKTAHNIYLIMEYCNEGDLAQYLKEKKYLTEEEAVDILLQIFNGFKTLVKNNILHRDFKLANLLKNDGQIKIADFGFSKLLGNDNFTNTMLGSPLNMAPEVLNNTEYNNKADIWSIGTCFYELLYGRPPFTASNMVDLLRNIQKNQVTINRQINNISKQAEDIIRKMLIVDPNKRIGWNDLFKHEINYYQEEKLKKDLEKSLKSENMMMSMSKFYINNNMVIDHPNDIKKKEKLNHYTMQVAQNGEIKQDYQGPLIRKPQEHGQISDQQQQALNQQEEFKKSQNDEMSDKVTKRELEIQARKKNSNRILHERNIYVFFASVAEESTQNTFINNYEYVAFLLVKKLVKMIDWLKMTLMERSNVFQLDFWDEFIQTKDFRDIQTYISKEYDVFKVYFDSIYDKLSKSKNIPEIIQPIMNTNYKQEFEDILKKILLNYCTDLVGHIVIKADQESVKNLYIHGSRILDCIECDKVFKYESLQTKTQFNFKQYYEDDHKYDVQKLKKRVITRLDQMNL